MIKYKRENQITLNRCPTCGHKAHINRRDTDICEIHMCPRCYCINPVDRMTELRKFSNVEYKDFRKETRDLNEFDFVGKFILMQILKDGYIEYKLSDLPEEVWSDVPLAPFKIKFNDIHKRWIHEYFSTLHIKMIGKGFNKLPRLETF